jgi:hypothetical protein
LALFGRRSLQRVVSLVIPATKNLHNSRHVAPQLFGCVAQREWLEHGHEEVITLMHRIVDEGMVPLALREPTTFSRARYELVGFGLLNSCLRLGRIARMQHLNVQFRKAMSGLKSV